MPQGRASTILAAALVVGASGLVVRPLRQQPVRAADGCAPLAPPPALRVAAQPLRAPGVRMQEAPFWENVVRFMRCALAVVERTSHSAVPAAIISTRFHAHAAGLASPPGQASLLGSLPRSRLSSAPRR